MVMVSQRSKYSEHINRKPASNVYHGIRIAETIGLPLNTFVSLNLKLTKCPPEEASEAFKKMRDTFAKWVRRPSVKIKNTTAAPTYVWVIENPNGHHNVHWLVHVPKKRKKEFEKLIHKLAAIYFGEITDNKAIHINRGLYNVRGLGKYILKGIQPEVAKFYGVIPESQGRIYGKRSGFSRNIGPKKKRELREVGRYRPAHRISIPSGNPMVSAMRIP
jgi:hypothetical protein